MKFPHINRRTHLYFGLFLTPWVLMYGLSSVPFSHNDYFEARDKAKNVPLWNKTFDGPYDLGPIPDSGSLRHLAARVAKDFQMEDSSFGAYRQSPQQLNVYIHTFWKSTQFKYFIEEKRITAEDRRFRFEHFLTGMHARGGFEDSRPFPILWAVLVDLTCLGFVLWILSGLYMWWSLPGLRKWGWVALISGLGSFLFFMWRL